VVIRGGGGPEAPGAVPELLQEMGQLLGMLGVAFGIGGMGTLKGGLCRKGAVRLSAIFPLAIPRTPNSP